MRLLANDLAPGVRILARLALRPKNCGNSNGPRSIHFPRQFLAREITKSHFTSNPLTQRLKRNAVPLRMAQRIKVSLQRFYERGSFAIEPVRSLSDFAPRAQVKESQ
jgi:hypothetical protein